MIYPINVHKQAQQAGNMTGAEVIRLGIALFIIGSVAAFFALDWLFTSILGFNDILAVVITIALIAIVGITILRFVVFDEANRMVEYERQESDSFAKYVNVRKDILNSISVEDNKIHCFEFIDGRNMCVFLFRYGSNDDVKATNTKNTLEQIFQILGEEDLRFRTINMIEDFEDSAEYDNYIRRLNAIPDKKLAKHQLDIAAGVLEKTEKMSNASCIYLMIETKPNLPLHDLETALRRVFAAIIKYPTAFRSIECLNRDKLLKLFRDFYGLETIDLSTMRVLELAEELDMEYKKVTSLYKVTDSDGKIFVDDSVMANAFHTQTYGD